MENNKSDFVRQEVDTYGQVCKEIANVFLSAIEFEWQKTILSALTGEICYNIMMNS